MPLPRPHYPPSTRMHCELLIYLYTLLIIII